MTILVGSKKVKKIIVGGDVFLPATDVWLPCEVNPDFSGTPILMHYDSATGKTMLVGQVTMPWSVDQGYWDDVLLTLPKGYHFTSSDGFLMAFNNSSNESYQTLSVTGPEMKVKFRWPFSDPRSGNAQLIFGTIGSLYASSKSFSTRTNIAPD